MTSLARISSAMNNVGDYRTTELLFSLCPSCLVRVLYAVTTDIMSRLMSLQITAALDALVVGILLWPSKWTRLANVSFVVVADRSALLFSYRLVFVD